MAAEVRYTVRVLRGGMYGLRDELKREPVVGLRLPSRERAQSVADTWNARERKG